MNNRLLPTQAAFVAVSLALGLLAQTHAAQPEPDFQSMFDGTDLVGWAGNPNLWSVEGGAITGRTTQEKPISGNTFLVWQGGDVGDFILRCSYRVLPGPTGFANSGIQYRSKLMDPASFGVGGYQADMEAGPDYSGILYDERGGAGGRSIMATRGEKVVWDNDCKKQVVGSLGKPEDIAAAIHKPGEWNTYEITVQGYHFIHKINGVTTVDVTDNCDSMRVARGIVALQLHAGDPMGVQFKDLRIKRLSADKKVVFIAGTPSHGPGEHEHRAGCLLLAKCLEQTKGMSAVVVTNGWPADASVFDGADAVVVYSDGGEGHPLLQGDRMKVISNLMRKGVGFGCIHYAVEVPQDHGGIEFLAWTGGYFETFRSVNPTWEANYDQFPIHPITRGVAPFQIMDEWYYHMRFLEGVKGLKDILSALPPDSTRGKPGTNDAHGGNPEVQKHMGDRETTMWALERPDGGRGFGFTGGHYHKNWGNENFRRVVLNGILWISKTDVPQVGAQSTLSPDELKANLDPKGR